MYYSIPAAEIDRPLLCSACHSYCYKWNWKCSYLVYTLYMHPHTYSTFIHTNKQTNDFLLWQWDTSVSTRPDRKVSHETIYRICDGNGERETGETNDQTGHTNTAQGMVHRTWHSSCIKTETGTELWLDFGTVCWSFCCIIFLSTVSFCTSAILNLYFFSQYFMALFPHTYTSFFSLFNCCLRPVA